MEHTGFTTYDIIQILLLLAACWACKIYGYTQGISDTIAFFEDKGIIELTDDAEIRKTKD